MPKKKRGAGLTVSGRRKKEQLKRQNESEGEREQRLAKLRSHSALRYAKAKAMSETESSNDEEEKDAAYYELVRAGIQQQKVLKRSQESPRDREIRLIKERSAARLRRAMETPEESALRRAEVKMWYLRNKIEREFPDLSREQIIEKMQEELSMDVQNPPTIEIDLLKRSSNTFVLETDKERELRLELTKELAELDTKLQIGGESDGEEDNYDDLIPSDLESGDDNINIPPILTSEEKAERKRKSHALRNRIRRANESAEKTTRRRFQAAERHRKKVGLVEPQTKGKTFWAANEHIYAAIIKKLAERDKDSVAETKFLSIEALKGEIEAKKLLLAHETPEERVIRLAENAERMARRNAGASRDWKKFASSPKVLKAKFYEKKRVLEKASRQVRKMKMTEEQKAERKLRTAARARLRSGMETKQFHIWRALKDGGDITDILSAEQNKSVIDFWYGYKSTKLPKEVVDWRRQLHQTMNEMTPASIEMVKEMISSNGSVLESYFHSKKYYMRDFNARKFNSMTEEEKAIEMERRRQQSRDKYRRITSTPESREKYNQYYRERLRLKKAGQVVARRRNRKPAAGKVGTGLPMGFYQGVVPDMDPGKQHSIEFLSGNHPISSTPALSGGQFMPPIEGGRYNLQIPLPYEGRYNSLMPNYDDGRYNPHIPNFTGQYTPLTSLSQIPNYTGHHGHGQFVPLAPPQQMPADHGHCPPLIVPPMPNDHGHWDDPWEPISAAFDDEVASNAEVVAEISLFICEVCAKEFGNEESLRRHKKMIHEKPLEKCPHCPMKYTRYLYLQWHIQRVHKIAISMPGNSSLELHNCSMCGARFSSSDFLNQHQMKFHQKYLGLNQSAQQAHVPVNCDLCGKHFLHQEGLKRHTKFVHGLRAHLQCPYCPKRVHLPEKIDGHIRLMHPEHAGTEPVSETMDEISQNNNNSKKTFECSICGKKYAKDFQLDFHMSVKHPLGTDRSFCEFCGKEEAVSYMNDHIRKRHPEQWKQKKITVASKLISGMTEPLKKMSAKECRSYIPLMIKYSTGNMRPGWGIESCRPPWWTDDVPWANLREDMRTEEQKKSMHCKEALRALIRSCYNYHGKSELLKDFDADSEPEDESIKKERKRKLTRLRNMRWADKKKRIFQCSGCKETFKDRLSRDSHITDSHPELAEICQHCGKRFTKENLEKHIVALNRSKKRLNEDEVSTIMEQPLGRMTHSQMRSHVPVLVRYSMIRDKPFFGDESKRPPWWPDGIPFQNPKSDTRPEDQKLKMGGKEIMKDVIVRCYRFHGKEELLKDFTTWEKVENDGEGSSDSEDSEEPLIKWSWKFVVPRVCVGASGPEILEPEKVKVLRCPVCRKNFKDNISKNNHISECHPELSETCQYCERRYTTDAIDKHMRMKHAYEERKLKKDQEVSNLMETPLGKMTQDQLRCHIPLLIRYSTGRKKPSWGHESKRPKWWPQEIPFTSPKIDKRTEEQKLKMGWTDVLKDIVVCFYVFYGKEELLKDFSTFVKPVQESEPEGSDSSPEGPPELSETCQYCGKRYTESGIVKHLKTKHAYEVRDSKKDDKLSTLMETPLGGMTKDQLGSHIPLLVRYSTKRKKPRWGNEARRPSWWPEGIAYVTPKIDKRTNAEKLKMKWTEVLKEIVVSFYRFYGKEDLVQEFGICDSLTQAKRPTNPTPRNLRMDRSKKSKSQTNSVNESEPEDSDKAGPLRCKRNRKSKSLISPTRQKKSARNLKDEDPFPWRLRIVLERCDRLNGKEFTNYTENKLSFCLGSSPSTNNQQNPNESTESLDGIWFPQEIKCEPDDLDLLEIKEEICIAPDYDFEEINFL